jgi:hypothetical protein
VSPSPPQSPSRRAAESLSPLAGAFPTRVRRQRARGVRPQNKHGPLGVVQLLQLAFYLGYRFYISTLQTKISQLS